MTSIKRISVIGAGAMGAAYASMFSDMDKNCISLVAKGERYDRLGEKGLIVNDKRYIVPVLGPEDHAPPADLVIVAVKHHHLPEAIQDMRHVLGEKTLIVSVMNGIESEEQIGAVYGMEKLLYAVVVGIDAVRQGNRVTFSKQGKLFFGEPENRVLTGRVKKVQALFDRAGILYETPADMIRILWWKFMINVGMNQVSAVLRAPYRVFHERQEARELMESAMREVITVAKAEDVPLSEEDIKDFYPFLLAMSPDGKTSMLQDVEAKRKTEVEMFAGKVNELGEKHGIPTPVNQTLFRLLRITEQYSD
ncbi:MAG: 2-dehydropantoate 2-reductase [Desulfobacteraceae bacterium]